MKAPAIEITDLNVSFRGKKVLEDANLSLPEGEFLGLIGPNGGGKTVLLKTILGLIKPTSGKVRIFGKTPLQAQGMLAYVPQFAKFDSDFPISVLDVTLMARLGTRRVIRSYAESDLQLAMEALSRVEMKEWADAQIGKLSGGQLQRVLIARALCLQPRMLLLDEPTASVDTKVGKTVYELLGNLSPEVTIILVSHDIGVISSHITSVACLNRKLHYHNSKEINSHVIEAVYGCPVDLLAHGHPHRVLGHHEHEGDVEK